MSLVSDPTILTKDRLREELQKHNVTLPRSDSKKSVYVDLYKRELLDNREKLEFSSDDEVELSSSKRKPRTKTPVKKPIKLTPSRVITTSKTLDVTALSDADLSEKLQDLGINVGPIMESTRKIYQKKLEKLLADAPREPPPITVATSTTLADTLPIEEFSDHTQDEEEEEEPEPEPEPPKPKKTVVKKSPARSERFEYKRSPLKPTRSSTRNYESRDQVDYIPTISSSNSTNLITKRFTSQETNSITEVQKPFSANNVVTQVAPPPPAAKENKKPEVGGTKKRRFPLWLQATIFILLAISIFLVIQNMEPANMNPFKSLPGK